MAGSDFNFCSFLPNSQVSKAFISKKVKDTNFEIPGLMEDSKNPIFDRHTLMREWKRKPKINCDGIVWLNPLTYQ